MWGEVFTHRYLPPPINDYCAGIAQKIFEDNPLSITNEVKVNTVKYNRNSMFLTPTTEEEVVDLIKGLDNKK
jgi:hypothetical protein